MVQNKQFVGDIHYIKKYGYVINDEYTLLQCVNLYLLWKGIHFTYGTILYR